MIPQTAFQEKETGFLWLLFSLIVKCMTAIKGEGPGQTFPFLCYWNKQLTCIRDIQEERFI